MACEYTFGGKKMSELEFKKLLLEDAELLGKAKSVEKKDTPTNGKRGNFKIRTKDGFEEVKGESVLIPFAQKLDAFVHKDNNGNYVVTETKTGLEIGRGKSKQDAIDAVDKTLKYQQAYNKSYPTIYETVNQHIDKSGAINGDGKYSETTTPKLSNKEKIEILEDKIREQEQEIIDERKNASRYFSTPNIEFQESYIKSLKKRIDEIKSEKEDVSRMAKVNRGTESKPIQEEYKTLTEEIEMPDGEKGVKVTIEKPDGEKVEIGNMYPEDVEKEVAKKIKGFELQKNKPTKTEEVVEEKPKQDVVGKEVQFKHAGGMRKGVVNSIDEQGNLKVKGKDGINYTVKPENAKEIFSGKDLIAEGIDELAKSIGVIKSISGEEKPDALNAMKKIAEGMLKEGIATSKDVWQKLVEYFKKEFPNSDLSKLAKYKSDVESHAKQLEKKSFIETVKDSPQTSEELNNKVSELDEFYEVVTNKETLAKADAEIKSDLQKAKEKVLSDSTPTAEKSAMAIRLIKHFEKSGDLDSAIEVLDSYDKQLREAGRFIQAASLWNRLAPETMVRVAKKSALKLGKDLPTEVQKAILERMSAIQKMEEGVEKDKATFEVLNYIADQLPTTKMELFDAYRYQNMLSNPRSHERNIYGNLFNVFITEPATIGVKAGYDLFKDPYNPMARNSKLTDIPKYYRDALSNIPNAFLAAKETYQKGYVADKILDLPKAENMIEAIRKTKLPKYLTFVMRALEAQDRFFSVMIAEGEKARLMRGGATEQVASKEAIKLANEYLYRDKLDASDKSKPYLVRALDALGQTINDVRNKPVIGKPFSWFVPFVTTPINVAKMGIKFSPLGFVGGDYNKGQVSQAALGSILTGVGATLAMQGLTTWAAPRDKKEKELFYASGRKPYSIKIGDKWVPMTYFPPFILSIGLPAAVKHYYEDNKAVMTDNDAQKIGEAIGSVSKFITSQTPMQGVDNFFETISGNEDASLGKGFGQLATQGIPLSGFVRYINQILDPVYRKSSGFVEQIESGLPELSKELEPYKEPTGEPAMRELSNIFLPYDIGFNKEEYDALLKNRREVLQERELAKKDSKKTPHKGKIKSLVRKR